MTLQTVKTNGAANPLRSLHVVRVIISPNDDRDGGLWLIDMHSGDVDRVDDPAAALRWVKRQAAALIKHDRLPGVITVIEWRDMPAGFELPQEHSTSQS